MQQVHFNNKLNEKKLESDISKTKNGQSKFDSCRFRSEDPVKKTIKRCACQGGSMEISGFQCYKRDIFNINFEICNYCSEFIAK